MTELTLKQNVELFAWLVGPLLKYKGSDKFSGPGLSFDSKLTQDEIDKLKSGIESSFQQIGVKYD